MLWITLGSPLYKEWDQADESEHTASHALPMDATTAALSKHLILATLYPSRKASLPIGS